MMEIPSREDFGMVWMGDMLLQNDSNDLMMEHVVDSPDSPFFLDPSCQSLTEDEIRCRNPMNIEGFMMLEDLEDSSSWYVNETSEEMILDNDSSNSSSAVTMATQSGLQNAPSVSRKIKPVKHPGLKLQTPIAYQHDTDLNVLPIQKEGRAVCQKCGAIGVKHAFYTRERRYCSLACARGSVDNDTGSQEICQSPSNTQWIKEEVQQDANNQPGQKCQSQYVLQTSSDESQLPSSFSIVAENSVSWERKNDQSNVTYSYDWSEELNDTQFSAAPASCFQHAPMSDLSDLVGVGLKVEVVNTDSCDYSAEDNNEYWIASVLRVEGYKALLRYEGFLGDNSKDFWVNLCSSPIHPVGYSGSRGKLLMPPKSIKDKCSNWNEFFKRRLTGARTLPFNFRTKVTDSLKSRFRCDLSVEVVDKNRISQVKVATIEKIIGKRLQLRYYDSSANSSELFWCHEDSPLIHPVGWARQVGHTLDASPEYNDRVMKGLRGKDDATADLFATPERVTLPPNCFFQENMKLEAINPLNPNDICVATVMQVLNDGYLMIKIDTLNDLNPMNDWFCCHVSSSSILPAGFCHANGIPLTPPKHYNMTEFDWNKYLQETNGIIAPPHFFNQVKLADTYIAVANVGISNSSNVPKHGFDVGMKIEAADILNPKSIRVAVITQIMGRLLKIRYCNWEKGFDYWVACDSCDVYPVGWCELVSHKLESPKSIVYDPNFIAHTKMEMKDVLNNDLVLVEDETIRVDQCYTKENSVNMVSVADVNSAIIQEIPQNSSIDSQLQQAILIEQNTCITEKPKIIPRLSEYKSKGSSANIVPESWDVNDVAEFLKINDCSTYCDAFIKQGVDGRKLVELTKDEVLDLAGMKVGPSLKIQNLITQLISKAHSGYSRHKLSKNILCITNYPKIFYDVQCSR